MKPVAVAPSPSHAARGADHWHTARPPRAGVVYERLLHPEAMGRARLVRHFALWDGKAWLRLAATPQLASQQTVRSLYNAQPWWWREVPAP